MGSWLARNCARILRFARIRLDQMKPERLFPLILMTWSTLVLSQDHAGNFDWSLSFRPRFEFVDQTAFSSTANALTMRTLAGFELKPSALWGARVEFIDVSQFTDDFNDTRNGTVTYPTVADPGNTDLNELYVGYSAYATLRAGRQAIRLNRTRFIGAQDFRQTMQVFDGVVIDFPIPAVTLSGDFSLYGAYFDRRTTVRASSSDDDVGIVRADWTWSRGNSLLFSAYWHDKQAQAAAAGTSCRIENIRWDGDHDAAFDARLNHTVEYAQQRSYANSEATRNARYARPGAGLIWPKAFARIDYEVLGSRDGIYGFQTPLANNHAYLGWSDLFGVTPPQGLQD